MTTNHTAAAVPSGVNWQVSTFCSVNNGCVEAGAWHRGTEHVIGLRDSTDQGTGYTLVMTRETFRRFVSLTKTQNMFTYG